jgi:3-isopropylmalate/(R)-2-methylmalate dehydratase small subunit
MLPVALTEAAVQLVLDRAEKEDGYAVEIDLERGEVRDRFGLAEPFPIDSASRQRLLEGKDEIDLILHHESDITAFEQRRIPVITV